MILPGATLGVLGGGQLGRMFAMSARSMGYRVVTWDPDPYCPAKDFSSFHLSAGFEDEEAIGYCLDNIDAVTTEFENVPAKTLERLSEKLTVTPPSKGVGICQDRIREKTFLSSLGFPVPEFFPVILEKDIDSIPPGFPFPALLKRSRLGYDGKGQILVKTPDEAATIFSSWGGMPCILEERVLFDKEISVILARNRSGAIRYFPVSENSHRQGVLEISVAPARIGEVLAKKAMEIAGSVAEKMEYSGILAVELFLLQDGRILVNELAPRPHNSGHFTLDACLTSQFEQQVRVLCGIPMGDTGLSTSAAMGNLMGDLWANGEPDWNILLESPRLKLHLYGKTSPRPGRKMGHFTVLAHHPDDAYDEVLILLQRLQSTL